VRYGFGRESKRIINGVGGEVKEKTGGFDKE